MQITKELLERRIGELAERISKDTGALQECEQILRYLDRQESIPAAALEAAKEPVKPE